MSPNSGITIGILDLILGYFRYIHPFQISFLIFPYQTKPKHTCKLARAHLLDTRIRTHVPTMQQVWTCAHSHAQSSWQTCCKSQRQISKLCPPLSCLRSPSSAGQQAAFLLGTHRSAFAPSFECFSPCTIWRKAARSTISLFSAGARGPPIRCVASHKGSCSPSWSRLEAPLCWACQGIQQS